MNELESKIPKTLPKCSDYPLIEDEESLKLLLLLSPFWEMIKEVNENGVSVNKLHRIFKVKNFQSGIDFITECGKTANIYNHHPDLHLTSYNTIEIVVYTHSLSGLTALDFDLVKGIGYTKIHIYLLYLITSLLIYI
jgi:4a-hydroxytetrahydrobiopterin dehydratase